MHPRRKTNDKINQNRKASKKRIKLPGRVIDYALYRLNIVNNDSDHLLHVELHFRSMKTLTI